MDRQHRLTPLTDTDWNHGLTTTTDSIDWHDRLTRPTHSTDWHHRLTPPTNTTDWHHRLTAPPDTTDKHYRLTAPRRPSTPACDWKLRMHHMFHFVCNLWVFFQCMLLSIFIKKAWSMQSPEDQKNLAKKTLEKHIPSQNNILQQTETQLHHVMNCAL